MSEPPQDPGRKYLPHLASREFANQSVIQFISCNVTKRRLLLARPEIHGVLLESWRKADHWLVGRYVIMPDHVHFFCAPRHVPTTPLKRWMEFWRADATRCWHELENPTKAKLVARWEDWPFQGELNVLRWHEAA